jgi:hypothetical protein
MLMLILKLVISRADAAALEVGSSSEEKTS